MANVVITSGAGFLGSRLARELLAAGSIEVAGGGAQPLSRVTLIDQAPFPVDLSTAEPRLVRSWPARIRADRAERLGLAPDPDFGAVVRMYLAESQG